MKHLNLGGVGVSVSAVALGVMRITKLNVDEATNLLESAHNAGINFFDNADIYDGGKAETLFGQALKKKPASHVMMSSSKVRSASCPANATTFPSSTSPSR